MRILKISTFALTALFAMSNFALAGTAVPSNGIAYTYVTSSTATPLADGSTLIRQTTHGLWTETSTEAGFPSDKVADCTSDYVVVSRRGA